eukprot:jgi/Botrbrau1/10259/Bobra.0140s0013.3
MEVEGSGALLHLARSFHERNMIVEAVKCYEALCGNGSEGPTVEALVRLELAEMLLQHTFNLHEARQHLERAHLVLRPVRGSFEIKCLVLSHLGRCCMSSGQTKLASQAYEKALEICQATRDNSAQTTEWQLHFLARLAQISAEVGDLAGAHARLGTAEQAAQDAGIAHYLVVLQLFRLQVLMSSSDWEAASEVLKQINPRLEALAGTGVPRVLIAQLRLHLILLKALLLIQQGNIAVLAKSGLDSSKGLPVMVEEMTALLSEARQQSWSYEWLPISGVVSLVALVATAVLRPSGRFAVAFSHLQPALDFLDSDLISRGICSTAREGDGPPHVYREARWLILLKALLLEMGAYLYLTTTRLKDARLYIAELLALHTGFSRTMRPLCTSTHMLAGCYALCTGHYQESLRHFSLVANAAEAGNGSAAKEVMAAVHTALTTLEVGGSAALPAAVEVLKQQSVYLDIPSTLPESVRAVALCVSGLVMVAQGETSAGKLRVSRVLKMGHTSLCNQQLIVQALNILAPVQGKAGDIEGMNNILQSSFTFAKHLQDIASQVIFPAPACIGDEAFHM